MAKQSNVNVAQVNVVIDRAFWQYVKEYAAKRNTSPGDVVTRVILDAAVGLKKTARIIEARDRKTLGTERYSKGSDTRSKRRLRAARNMTQACVWIPESKALRVFSKLDKVKAVHGSFAQSAWIVAALSSALSRRIAA